MRTMGACVTLLLTERERESNAERLGEKAEGETMRFFKLMLLLERLGFRCWGPYYHCSGCGLLFPKEGVKVSGWDAEPSGRHVHCPRYGKKIYV